MRYEILPVADKQALPEAMSKEAGANYLMEELPARIAKSPVGFRLVARVVEASGAINDGSVVLPVGRKLVGLGRNRPTGTSANQVTEQKTMLFSPLSLAAGTAPSDDPALVMRPAA